MSPMKKWEKALRQQLKDEFQDAFPPPVPEAPSVKEVQMRKSPVRWIAPVIAAAFVFCLVIPLLFSQIGLPIGPAASEPSLPYASSSSVSPNNSATDLPSGVSDPESSGDHLGIETATLEEARKALDLPLKEPALCQIRELHLFPAGKAAQYILEKDGQEIGSIVIGKGEVTIDTALYQRLEESGYPFYILRSGLNIELLLNDDGVCYSGTFYGISEDQMVQIMRSVIVFPA